MDSQDNLSIHSSNPPSSHSSHSHSHNPSSGSSSQGPHSLGSGNNSEEMDRHEENTIGFDSFSNCSDDPLNNGFVRNEDSFFSEFQSLYSCKSRVVNQFSNSMDDSELENPYECNSFSSFHSVVQSRQGKGETGRKGSRQRSRERQKKSSHGIFHQQTLEPTGTRKGQNGFKKRK